MRNGRKSLLFQLSRLEETHCYQLMYSLLETLLELREREEVPQMNGKIAAFIIHSFVCFLVFYSVYFFLQAVKCTCACVCVHECSCSIYLSGRSVSQSVIESLIIHKHRLLILSSCLLSVGMVDPTLTR